jgi:hypothetical protein
MYSATISWRFLCPTNRFRLANARCSGSHDAMLAIPLAAERDSGRRRGTGRTTRRPGASKLHVEGAVSVVVLPVETAGVAKNFITDAAPPKRGFRRSAVCAHGRLLIKDHD